jgi:hypothetical protein
MPHLSLPRGKLSSSTGHQEEISHTEVFATWEKRTFSFLTRHEIFITYKSSTTFYPPCPLPGAGIRSTLLIITRMLLNVSQFNHHTHIVTWLSVFNYYFPSINYLHVHQFLILVFSLLFFGLCTLVWEHEYGVRYFVDTSFDIRTARVQCQGELSPPLPGHAPPARRAVLPRVLYNTCALIEVT